MTSFAGNTCELSVMSMRRETMKIDTAPNFPLQITFRHPAVPPAAESWIRSEAAKMQNFYSRILGCRVTIESPHQHRRFGGPYHVRIELIVPGGKLVIRHEPSLRTAARQTGEREVRKCLEVRTPHKYLHQAINDSFKAAGRVLEDYARRQRGDVKKIEKPPRATVTQIFPDKYYGFLVTPDGREIYFHADSVLNGAFGHLKVGTVVTFAEEQGDKGPQASTVRIVGKQGRSRSRQIAA